MTEYQILEAMIKMMVYATTCKANNNDEKAVAIMIVYGFTGTLRSWWDNFLTLSQKLEILNSVKTETNELGQISTRMDATYTLAQTILYHFIGLYDNNAESYRYLL